MAPFILRAAPGCFSPFCHFRSNSAPLRGTQSQTCTARWSLDMYLLQDDYCIYRHIDTYTWICLYVCVSKYMSVCVGM